MERKLGIAGVLSFLVLLVPYAGPAQEKPQSVEFVARSTDAQLESLQNQVAQLRRQLRERRTENIQDRKEWQEDYQETRERITERQRFVNRYALFE